MSRIGIFGISGQSGAAYLADLISDGQEVYGYCRPSVHGSEVVEAIRRQGGVQVDRPPNELNEQSRFVPLGTSEVGHDLERLANTCDLIIFAYPSLYHEDAARQLSEFLSVSKRVVPIVLSPSRTLAVPYLWRILGGGYPVVSFQTCPYACKCYSPGSVFIKRRKRAWLASIEGQVDEATVDLLGNLFPHMVYSQTPAATSLGNLGAVFHPTAYLLNLAGIRKAEAENRVYSFYQEGIAHNPTVGPIVEEVDQIRLQIAAAIGCPVFGLHDNPREEEWQEIMAQVHAMETTPLADLWEHRHRRSELMQPIHDAVVSAQHWLGYTYGVKRIPGESLASAVGRTPNFMQNSCPQERYADEDVATGLVPFEALALGLGIPCEPISRVIDLYVDYSGNDARETGRNLQEFAIDGLQNYLMGETQCLVLVS